METSPVGIKKNNFYARSLNGEALNDSGQNRKPANLKLRHSFSRNSVLPSELLEKIEVRLGTLDFIAV